MPLSRDRHTTHHKDAQGITHAAVEDALRRGQMHLAKGEEALALGAMQDAIRIAPDNAAVLSGLGVALRHCSRLEEAAAAFEQVLALQPGLAHAQVYLAMIRLAQGRQAEGWPLYRARWRSVHWPEKMRYPESALWDGKIATGLRLLLWGEQGFGDMIQFARYAPWLNDLLSAKDARLVLEVAAPLVKLLRLSWPALVIVAAGTAHGRFDAHLPLMDLPAVHGNLVGASGLPYTPVDMPYFTAAPDPQAQQRGIVCISDSTNRVALRVGIAWQGRRNHPDDRRRSIPISELSSLFAVPGIRWVSLQKHTGSPDAHPHWLPDELASCQDFADTACIVNGLDLVISIDSAVAHLAGALGKPVWLLLPAVVDWRWRLEGEDTPWYPSIRLIRQSDGESWHQTLIHTAVALHAWREQRQT